MGRRASNKDELFAQNLAAGMDQVTAYEAAGFKPDSGAASRKANTPEMRVLVENILDAKVSAQIVDTKWVMREYIKTYYRAVDQKDLYVCRSALHDIGQELGMFVDRKDVRVYGRFERMSNSEMLQELTDVTEQLAIKEQERTQ